MSQHNKRRNAGLLYEFLVRKISSSLVEGDQKASSRALKILKKHFKPGRELYKELKLINSLVKTTVSSESVAASIMHEAKLAARNHVKADLDRQKSLLISDINKILQDDNFYDQQIDEYKTYATIQTLLNEWRSSSGDLELQARYEDQLVKWLTSEKATKPDVQMGNYSPGTSRLLMKVMMQKLNQKYASVLSESQKSLVRAYAFSTANNEPVSIKKKLEEIKQRLLMLIDGFDPKAEQSGEYLSTKLEEVKQRLLAEDVSTVDDESVARFMLYVKLIEEMETKGDGDA